MTYRRFRDRGKSSVVPLVVVSVIVLGLGGAAAFLFRPIPSFPNRDVAPTSMTLSNAKQVALAALMYCADWDDRYPLGMSSQREFQRATYPYVMNSAVYRSLNPAGGMIGPNPNLAAVPAEGILDPAATPMVFEPYDWSDGTRIVAFADGHAKKVDGFDENTDLGVELDEDAQRIVDKIALADASAPPATRSLGMPGG
ncbi:MAG: hypothetical protein IH945_11250 [Armatimonadetes bacterium]|nr:hypothetical protein [Armatimonadota bacterium]